MYFAQIASRFVTDYYTWLIGIDIFQSKAHSRGINCALLFQIVLSFYFRFRLRSISWKRSASSASSRGFHLSKQQSWYGINGPSTSRCNRFILNVENNNSIKKEKYLNSYKVNLENINKKNTYRLQLIPIEQVFFMFAVLQQIPLDIKRLPFNNDLPEKLFCIS